MLQERAAALENELRKSKRAEQKLQALLYRLRQDVAEVKQGADLMAKLEDQRSLEYEVDFLTNKVKVGSAVESLHGFRWHDPACTKSAQQNLHLLGGHGACPLQGIVLGRSPLKFCRHQLMLFTVLMSWHNRLLVKALLHLCL
jgi:hypothetical protein